MTSPHPAWRLAQTGARALGASSALAAAGMGVLIAEAQLARRVIGNVDDRPPAPSGWYGQGRPGPALKVALIGDSSAAGYGVTHVEETPGAIIASGVAEAADRRVYLSSVAVVGSQSKDLAAQVDRVLPMEPHVAVLFIGGNDVTHVVPVRTSTRLLADQIRRLLRAGVEVVVCTCPDLGAIQPLAVPLKQVARVQSRRLAASQATATLSEGGRTVALASILTDEFETFADLLFGPDKFHPSAAGYARMAYAVLPTVLSALGLGTAEEGVPEYALGEAVLPIDIAVLEAARHPGASLEPMPQESSAAGERPRFVLLRRPRSRADASVESPTDDESSEAGLSPEAADES